MDDYGFIDGGDNRGGDGHILDGEPGTIRGVVFAGLGCVVKIFFLLNRGSGRVRDRGYASEPFDTSVFVYDSVISKEIYSIGQGNVPCSNIPKYHCSYRIAMDLW